MARLNQSGGRTSEAWRKRYEARSALAQRRLALLEAAGVTGLGTTEEEVAGAGVPGHSTVTRLTKNGEVLGRRELMALCREHDIPDDPQ